MVRRWAGGLAGEDGSKIRTIGTKEEERANVPLRAGLDFGVLLAVLVLSNQAYARP